MTTTQTTDEGERLVKLALFVKEQGPVSFTDIRSGLHEYAFYDGSDASEERKHEQRVRRMFMRDKAALEASGVFLRIGSDNRYRLDEQASFAAPVDLTDAQASLLRLMCASLLADGSYALKSELRMVLAKIGDELEVPDLLPFANADHTSGESVTGLQKVQKAIASRKRLSFGYRNASGVESTREVEPFGAFFLNKRCYVAAFDPQAGENGEERLFRLDRMSRPKVNAARPTVPDFEPRAFDVEAWQRLPFQFGDAPFEATVRFDADNAWRAERLSMGKGSFEEQGDELLWHVEARDAQRLARWCVEQGPGIEPESPAWARDVYRDGLRAAWEAHRER